MKNDTRREFLKTTGAAAAMAGYAAGSGVIRVGVVGCGGRGEAAAMNAMNAGKDIRIVALGDIRPDRIREVRAKLREKYPQQVEVKDEACFAGFDAYRHVIEASDVVLIANAAKFHPLHTLTALQAGRHVFCEKPHAIDPYGIRTLQSAIEVAQTRRLSLVSGLQSRYHPGYQETMRRVHEGAIGDIVAIQETWLRPPYVLRDREPGAGEVEHQAANQYHFHWLCGDDVPQTLIHNLDRSSWAMRNQAPRRAWGMAGRSTLHAERYGDVLDHHAVVYEFAGGVRIYAYCRTIDHCYEENSSLILGTKGRCDLLKLTITGETNWMHPGPRSKNNAYDLEQVALFNSIRDSRPLNNGEYMVRSTLITLMGQFSCYTGKEVAWDEISGSSYCHLPRPEDVRADMEPPVRPGPDGVYPLPFTPGVTGQLL